MSFARVFVLFSVVSALMGCGSGDSGSDAEQAFMAAKRQWAEQAIVDYRYTFVIECGLCFPPSDTYPGQGAYAVTVKDGVIESANRLSGNQEALNDAQLEAMKTVDDLFAVIEDAIERSAGYIDVEYDGQYRYPTSIFIDRSDVVADDETEFSSGSLVPLS